ncbi:MAG: acyl-ACP--UDP-N-acetylglucosamine O-acyltransferase [Candidatus Eremiobacteraeota bacterium]|nr:acyl-ACP--UDP-N-acetylglucosamine O-acyltransferase [Candidatus Eremiobacteraeota bacterium]MBV8356122.1 acyl-ACP--UDP-N-acetylglucosamine O-acyltransferase [Candidatus Eremiobacteraeota bacterium]
MPARREHSALVIHGSAVVHPSAKIDPSAEVGPNCVIGDAVEIGARTKLLAHVVVNGRTRIGEDCSIYPFASIGMPSQDRKAEGEERSFTFIGDRTTIREYVSIHRASGAEETTWVGDDCLLLAYVHIAHNCRIGNSVTMSNLAQLAGHCIVEDHASFGGMTGTHQFVRVGRYSFVGGMTRLARDVPPFLLVEGNPAKAYGLNSVGLRRAEFPPDVLAELKECYKIMYHSNRNLSQALVALKEIVKTDAGRHLIAFLEGESARGILK